MLRWLDRLAQDAGSWGNCRQGDGGRGVASLEPMAYASATAGIRLEPLLASAQREEARGGHAQREARVQVHPQSARPSISRWSLALKAITLQILPAQRTITQVLTLDLEELMASAFDRGDWAERSYNATPVIHLVILIGGFLKI